MKKLVVITATLIIPMLYLLFAPTAIRVEPKAVARSDIEALMTCMKDDRCKVPRGDVLVDGRRLPSLSIVNADGLEIRYTFPGDGSFKVMLTRGDNPLLLEDFGYSGMVRRITELSGGEVRMFESGPEFENRFPVAQHMYYKAMEHAKRIIIPEGKRA